jgi:hypothetical protein
VVTVAKDGSNGGGDGGGSRVEQALRLLAEEARQRVARHPAGHLISGRGEAIDLALTVPTGGHGGRFDALAADAAAALDRAVAALVAHRSAFRPGAVYCLRCNRADCEHAEPPGPRHVFAGYGNTGVPRYLDFAQLLLERSDPRVDRLYQERPALLAHTVLGADLTGELLPAYRDNEPGFRLHGQVAAGWYRVPDSAGRPAVLALTFQVVSTRPSGSPRRYGLNVLGIGPEGEPLEHLFDRLGTLPWADSVRWAQEALESLERAVPGRKGGEEEGTVGRKPPLKKRITGVLDGLSRRLEKDRRAAERKTVHARGRHAQGDRPTRMALADLARAGEDDVLVDRRQDTLVVLGDKGRAHVFNFAGKLVTSIRYNPESIERRRQRDQWRPASGEEIARLRGSVGAAEQETQGAASRG